MAYYLAATSLCLGQQSKPHKKVEGPSTKSIPKIVRLIPKDTEPYPHKREITDPQQLPLFNTTSPPTPSLVAAYESSLIQLYNRAPQDLAPKLDLADLTRMSNANFSSEAKVVSTALKLLGNASFSNEAASASGVGEALNSLPPHLLLSKCFESLSPDGKGTIELCRIFHTHLMSLSTNALQTESTQKNNLVSAYMSLVDSVALTNNGYARNIIQATSVPLPSDFANEDLKKLRDVSEVVENEFAAVRKLNTTEGFRTFYRKRYSYKEAPLARSCAFQIYATLNKAEGYITFLKEYGTAAPEFVLAIERKRNAELRDASLLDQSIPATNTNDWVEGAHAKINVWDDLVVKDLAASHVGYARDRGKDIAKELEEARKAGTDEASNEKRANQLFKKFLDVNDKLAILLGTDPISVITNTSLSSSDLKRPEVIRLFLQRYRLYWCIREAYGNTVAAANIGLQNVVNVDVWVKVEVESDQLMDAVRSGFTRTFAEIATARAEIKSYFEKVDEHLVHLDSEIKEFRNETKSSIAALSEHLDKMDKKLDQLQLSINEVNENVKNALQKLEVLSIQNDAIAKELSAFRKAMFPAPWPGNGKTDEYVQSWELDPDLKNALAGVIEGHLRTILDGKTFQDEGESSHVDWYESWWVKTIIAEYTVNWKIKLSPKAEETHFNLNSLKAGYDKISGNGILFIDLSADVGTSGTAAASIVGGPGTGEQDFTGRLKLNAQLRLEMKGKGDSLEWTIEAVSFDLTVKDLSFGGYILDMCRADIQNRLNTKLDDIQAEIGGKVIDALTRRSADLLDKMKVIEGQIKARIGH